MTWEIVDLDRFFRLIVKFFLPTKLYNMETGSIQDEKNYIGIDWENILFRAPSIQMNLQAGHGSDQGIFRH
jgi:hypothetical protein